MKLDAKNPVPLYEQLKILLQSQINTGVYSAGEKLPAEFEMCAKHEVSRVTVRRALDDLVADGVLERRQGKGTFVASKKPQVPLLAVDPGVKGFMGTLFPGFEKHTRVIFKKEYACNTMEQKMLELQEDDKVHVYLRLMSLNDMPFYLDRATYPAGRFSDMFHQVKDDVSTYTILREQYGVGIMKITRKIKLTYATEEQASLLKCAVGSPLFQLFKMVRDENSAPVHISYTYYIADRVEFTSESVE